MSKEHIVVIGAGVVGVSTAYVLARDGYQVTLIDERSQAGEVTSAGNAAQLSWAYGDAMASPALLRHLPGIIMGRDPAFCLECRLDLDFLLWGLRFLANCSRRAWWANTRANLELAELSRLEMEHLTCRLDLDFGYRIAGKLHLYPDAASLEAAQGGVRKKQEAGLVQQVVDRAAAERIEPVLAGYAGEIAGAIHTPGDAVGDAAAFCRGLAAYLQRNGVRLLFGYRVASFRTRAGALWSVRFTDREELGTTRAVLATGPTAAALGAFAPEARAIQPVRGYSLTVPAVPGAPRVSLTDVKRKLAFVHLGDRCRVAGLADLLPAGNGFDAARLAALRQAAQAVLPRFWGDDSLGTAWSGERPMTACSVPIIAPSRRLRGLYLNIGHGMLGWTLALGSARRLLQVLQA